MILKYLGFFFSVLAAYSLVKTQSIFSKKTGILFTLFVSKISWLTLIITSYYGFKNFNLIWFLSGILIPVATIEISYKLLSNYIKNKFPDTTKLQKVKTIIEYLIIFLIVKFVFFKTIKTTLACRLGCPRVNLCLITPP